MEERRQAAAARRRLERALSYVRLAIFLCGAALLWPTLVSRTLAWGWLLVPVAAFVLVALLHDRVIRRRMRADRAVSFYTRGLARLDDRWSGNGTPGEQFADPHHPYASDLDLYGHGSLFELLCAARTRSGERTLAAWLGAAAPPAEVRERQAAVEELRHELDLREDLALVGEEVGGGVDPEALTDWASSPPVLVSRWAPRMLAALAIVNYFALAAWVVVPAFGRPAFLASVVVTILAALAFRARVRKVIGGVEGPEHQLELLAQILDRIERQSFKSPRLVALRRPLDVEGKPASRRIAHLARLVETHDSCHNVIFAPFARMMLLETQIAFALERWRASSGAAVEQWLASVGEIEALSSFAAFAYEHPEDPFPEIIEQETLFQAEGLGHPLLPVSRCVRNDVALGGGVQLHIVSGSNMSGKSTLLRTVGINVVLALAGAPVRAKRLRLSPLAIGACMRVQDSLQEGTSHFYAEIKRLRQIVELASGPWPLLFLLDEILHGTNSHDRRLGAAALLRGLVERGAIGLVTTHDLALAQIADDLAPAASNVHFEDHLEGNKIAFDYVLRPGVVRRSNALALMRAVGLEV